MKNKILDVLCLAGGVGLFAWAGVTLTGQTVTVAIAPNTAYKISFDALDEPENMYRLWCDGQIVKNYTASETNLGKAPTKNTDGTTTITVSAPGLTAGSHSCLVSAFNDLGEVKSDPITIPIGNIPTKPVNLKIVVDLTIK